MVQNIYVLGYWQSAQRQYISMYINYSSFQYPVMHTKIVKILILCATDKYLQNRENGHKCSTSRV